MDEREVYLSVIVPAYNEASRIEMTLLRMQDFLSKKPYHWEIIVVSDGATDGTVNLVERLKRSIPQLRCIDRKQNRGKGYTVREGILAATGRIRLFADADNATDIAHFELMRPLFDQGADIVIASRDSKDARGARQSIPQSPWKRVLGNMGNLYIQLLAVRGIWDTQCGFKAFRADAARKIFRVSRIDRWGFDIEALALARHFGYNVRIIGVDWKNDEHSHVRMSAYLQVLWETTKIGWWIRARTYERQSHSTNTHEKTV